MSIVVFKSQFSTPLESRICTCLFFPSPLPARLHLLPAMLCLCLEISGDGRPILVRVPEVPGVGDDFLGTLVNPQGLQVSVVPGVGATLLGLSAFCPFGWSQRMATLCISEHRLRLTKQFFLLMFPVKYLSLSMWSGVPGTASPLEQNLACVVLCGSFPFSHGCLYPLLYRGNKLPVGCDRFWSRHSLPKCVCPASGPLCPLKEQAASSFVLDVFSQLSIPQFHLYLEN